MRRTRRDRISCPFLLSASKSLVRRPRFPTTPSRSCAASPITGVRSTTCSTSIPPGGRFAAWEIIFNDDVPDRVAIDEALGLAKTLSDGDSPAFIHGLLSAICDDTEGREAILHPENDEPDAQPSDDGQEPGEPAGEASHAEAETGDSEASEDDDIADGVDFDDMTFGDVSDDVAEAASEQTADPQAGQQDGESTSK